jgi:hypothetical protein
MQSNEISTFPLAGHASVPSPHAHGQQPVLHSVGGGTATHVPELDELLLDDELELLELDELLLLLDDELELLELLLLDDEIELLELDELLLLDDEIELLELDDAEERLSAMTRVSFPLRRIVQRLPRPARPYHPWDN